MSEAHVSLLPFHLGALDEDALDAAQSHLLECRACLSDYLTLKRRFDSAAAFEERPSPFARERLRKEVRRRLASRLPRPRYWAAVALAAGVILFAWLKARPVEVTPPVGETLVDTSTDIPSSETL